MEVLQQLIWWWYLSLGISWRLSWLSGLHHRHPLSTPRKAPCSDTSASWRPTITLWFSNPLLLRIDMWPCTPVQSSASPNLLMGCTRIIFSLLASDLIFSELSGMADAIHIIHICHINDISWIHTTCWKISTGWVVWVWDGESQIMGLLPTQWTGSLYQHKASWLKLLPIHKVWWTLLADGKTIPCISGVCV